MQSTLPVVQANQLILSNGYTVNNLRSKLHGPSVLTASLGVQIQENLNAIVSTPIFEENYPHLSPLSGRATNLKIKKNEVYLIQDGREIPLIKAAQHATRNSEKALLTFHATEIIRKARELKISRNSDHYLHPFPETMYLDPDSRDERIKALERDLLEETKQNAQARKVLQSATLERDRLAQEVTSLRDKLERQTIEMDDLQEENDSLKSQISQLRKALVKSETDLAITNRLVDQLTQELKLAEAKASAAEERCNDIYRELELQQRSFKEERTQFQLTIHSLQSELQYSLETQNEQTRSLEEAHKCQHLLESEIRTKTSQLEALQEKNRALEEAVSEFEIVRLKLLTAQLEIGEKNLLLEDSYEELLQAQQRFEEELNRIHQRHQKQLELGALDITELQDTHRLEMEELKRDHQKALDELSAIYKALEQENGNLKQKLQSAHHQLDLAQIDKQRLEDIIALKEGELNLASSENKILENQIAELKKQLIAKEREFQDNLSELKRLLQIQKLNAQLDHLLSQSELNRTKKELQEVLSRESQTNGLTQEQEETIHQLQERISSQERLLEERNLALRDIKEELSQYGTQLDEKNVLIERLRETIRTLEANNSQLTSQHLEEEKKFRAELQKALYLKDEALARVEDLDNDNRQLRANLQRLQNQIRELQDQKNDINETALEEMQNQILAMTEEREVMETRLQKQQHELYDLKRQLQERGHQIETLQSENELLRRENEEYKLHRAEYQESIRLRISLQQQLSHAKETISELQQKLRKLEKQNEARTSETHQVGEANSKLREKIASLEDEKVKIEEEHEGLLNAAKKVAKQTETQLKSQIEELERTIQKLTRQIALNDEEIIHLSSANESLLKAFSEYQTNTEKRISDLEYAIDTLRASEHEKALRIEKLQKSLNKKEDLLAATQQNLEAELGARGLLEALQPQMEALLEVTETDNIEGIKSKIIELNDEVQRLREALDRESEQRLEIVKERDSLNDKLLALKQERDTLQLTITTQLELIDRQSSTITSLQEELKLAQRERDEASEKIHDIRLDLEDARENLAHESERAQRNFDELQQSKKQSTATLEKIYEKVVQIQELERDLTRKDQLLEEQDNRIHLLTREIDHLRFENTQFKKRLAEQAIEVEELRNALLSRPPEEEVVETQSNIEEEEVTPEPSVEEDLEAILDVLGGEAIKQKMTAETAHRLQKNKECTPNELTINYSYPRQGSRKTVEQTATTKSGSEHRKGTAKLTTLNQIIGRATNAKDHDVYIRTQQSSLYNAYEKLAKPFEFLHDEAFKAALERIREAKKESRGPSEEDVQLIQENTTKAIGELIKSCFTSTSKRTDQGMEMHPILNLRCLLLYYKHYYPENPRRSIPKEIKQKIQKIENLISALDMFFSFVEIPESASSSMGSTGDVEVTFFAPKK